MTMEEKSPPGRLLPLRVQQGSAMETSTIRGRKCKNAVVGPCSSTKIRYHIRMCIWSLLSSFICLLLLRSASAFQVAQLSLVERSRSAKSLHCCLLQFGATTPQKRGLPQLLYAPLTTLDETRPIYSTRYIYSTRHIYSTRNINPTRRRTWNQLYQLRQSFQEWEGDDIRWSSKLRRNMRRSLNFTRQPVRNILVGLNIAAFVYQTINSVDWIRTRYPAAWPNQAFSIVWDTVLGSSRPGPMTMDFVHSALFSARQPHRYLTAGFLHGNIFHLLLNMDALRRMPAWLEIGLGAPLYLTTFLAAVVAGNLAHTATALNGTLCMGASGGICGLYGLLYVCLVRMGNSTAAWRVAKGMATLFLVGTIMTNVSNAGHAGGFAAGIVIGILSGPSYRKSYALRRNNSLEVDIYSRDYRTAMGFDKVPSERGLLPVPLLLVTALVVLSTQAKFRTMPQLVLQGMLHPGSLTGLFRL